MEQSPAWEDTATKLFQIRLSKTATTALQVSWCHLQESPKCRGAPVCNRIAEEPLDWGQLHSHSSQKGRSRCTWDTQRVLKPDPLIAVHGQVRSGQQLPDRIQQNDTWRAQPLHVTVWGESAQASRQPGESCQCSTGQRDRKLQRSAV